MARSADIPDAVFALAGLPAPEREHLFARPRLWRFDFAWPALLLAVEVEGGVWTRGRHTRGQGFIDDMEKYNRAAVLGWSVLRVTPQQAAGGQLVLVLLDWLSQREGGYTPTPT
jgi:hypothetical protein